MLESGIFGTLFLKMSVVRFLELIDKIGIAKIGITKIGIPIRMDCIDWDADWDGLLKLGSLKLESERTIASGECKPATNNHLAYHQCDWLVMPPANHLTTFLDHCPCKPTHFLPLHVT
jgi:hypothetical protein